MSNSEPFVDLFSVQFWWVVGLGLLTVVPCKRGPLRSSCLAIVNLSLVVILLRAQVAVVLAGALLGWAFLRAMTTRFWALAAWVGGIAVLVLFVIHKLPVLVRGTEIQSLVSPMFVVGFSYVALRLVEVARAVIEQRHSPPDLASTVNYLIPFHMLAAGPIQSYDEFVAQPAVPEPLSFQQALACIERIAGGLFKKFVVANLISALFLTGFRARGSYLFLEAQLHFIWIYLDFSAYTDVAVGIGGLLGVLTPENFNRPYLARNMIDFWERWHISLSLFVRRNVFIPIQLAMARRSGGQMSLMGTTVAFSVSFLLVGLWHGVDWRWLGWGACHATGLVLCNAYRQLLLNRLGRKGFNRYLANPWIRAVMTIVTFEFVAFSLVLATYPFEEVAW
jgi:D-alanyl-lipoteichoic acid acyltransferase DltB (MBOAT superfamily)